MPWGYALQLDSTGAERADGYMPVLGGMRLGFTNELAFLHSDVLTVGHHGSKTSTTPEFLNAVRPQVSIILAGEENTGIPVRSIWNGSKRVGCESFKPTRMAPCRC